MQKQTGFSSRISGLEQAQRFGESSRQGQTVLVGVPTTPFIPNFEEEFLARGERGVSREVPQVSVNFNEAWEQAEIANIRFPEGQEAFPQNFNQAWQENLQSAPPAIWQEEREQLIRQKMQAPDYIKFTDVLIRAYSENSFISNFIMSTSLEAFMEELENPLGEFSEKGLNSYLSVLALANTRTGEEFTEAKNTTMLYYFLYGLVAKRRENLRPILQERTEIYNAKLVAYINERGKEYFLNFAFQNQMDIDGNTLYEILEDPATRYHLSVEMENWDYKKIKNLLMDNYDRKQLRTSSDGYKIRYNDTTPKEKIIERLLNNKQASKDLLEMMDQPPGKWIVEKKYTPQGFPLRETRRDGTVTYFHENGLLDGPFERIDHSKHRLIGQYRNGDGVGVWNTYNEKGKLLNTVNWDDKKKMMDFFQRNYSHDQLKQLAKGYQIRFGVFDDPPDEYLVVELFKMKRSREDILEMMKGDPKDWLVEKTFWSNRKVRSLITRGGLVEHYYENGELEDSGNILNGKRQGSLMKFQKDGSLEQELTYKDGILNGKTEEFWRNGNIRMRGEYKDDQPIGLWEEFDENGKLISKTIHGKEEPEQLSVRDSRKLWELYTQSLKDPSKISDLLKEIPEKDGTLYAPEDFDIFQVDEALSKGQKNKYLPSRNPKSFEPIIQKLREVYYKPFPRKSFL